MKIAYVVGNDNPTDPDPDLDIPFATEAAAQLDIDLVFSNWNDKVLHGNLLMQPLLDRLGIMFRFEMNSYNLLKQWKPKQNYLILTM